MRILLVGSNGRMGKIMQKVILENGHTFCGIDLDNRVEAENYAADVVLDFSSSACLKENLEIAERKNIPIVIGTTGHNEENLRLIDEYKSKIAVFKGSNFSILFNLLLKIAKSIQKMPDCDYILEEIHHKHKKDSPSGSAKELLKVLEKNGISPVVSANRVGEVVGIHSLSLYLGGERLELRHEATSREVFCEGALKACEFVLDKKCGLYNMQDLLEK